MPNARRLKSTLLGAAILVNVGVLASWTQNWLTVTLAPAAGHKGTIDVVGSVAAPALSALALAGLALVGALAIAGPVFRIVLGILEAVIGACVGYSALAALLDPAAAGAGAVTEATGVAGSSSVGALVESSSLTAWPVITLILGVLLAIVGLATAVTFRAWPGSSKKYQAVRFVEADPDAEADPVVTWDDLSRGDDPTRKR